MIPILNPAGVQEILDFGLYGYAMSRFCSTWVALKCIKDTVESTAIVDASLDRVNIVIPDIPMPPGGLGIRPKDGILEMEARLHDWKRDAMVAFVQANGLNRIVTTGGPNARIGVITVGKSYLDVRQAMDDLGIDEVKANDMGLRIFKIGCPWPLDPVGLKDFARGLDLIIVVEEKRSLIEVQVREELYGAPDQPACHRQEGRARQLAVPGQGRARSQRHRHRHRRALAEAAREPGPGSPRQSAEAGAGHAGRDKGRLDAHALFLLGLPAQLVHQGARGHARLCGHRLPLHGPVDGPLHRRLHPDGRRGRELDRRGAFSKRGHIFQNLGDGTWNHSGVLALRFALASKVNITYKLLFNDAVAMTGGQRHEGGLTVDALARQVAAEGVTRIALVSDDPDKYPSGTHWPAGIDVPSSRRTGHRPARSRRDPGRHGDRLRPDLRRREAPPPQAGRDARSRQARLHQHAGLRGLRRLRREVELRVRAAGRDGIRPQAADRPVELQQGLLLRQRLLPVLRDGGRRDDPQGCAGGGKGGRGRIRRRWGPLPEPRVPR